LKRDESFEKFGILLEPINCPMEID